MNLSENKILFIITHLELGGAQRQLLYIIKNLSPKKYSVYLCSGDYGYLKKEFSSLPHLNIKFIPQLVRNIHPLYDVISFLKLYFYIKRNNFYIVHTHSPKASFLGRWAAYLAGVKNIIYTVHGWPFHRFMNPLSYYFYLFLEKITAKITKTIIVVSRADLKTGRDKRIASKNKFVLIHYGVEIEKFDKVFREKNLQSSNLIVTISSLKPQKGLSYFLEMAKAILKEMPDLNFIIAGDGPLRKKIETKIKLLNINNNVFLTGWVEDIVPLLEKSAIFVLTSLWEGLPVALIEAVIAGIPAVVTNTGGISDIMKDKKQGIILKTMKPLEAKTACLNILHNYEEWNKIITTDRNYMDIFYWSIERMLRGVENIYRQC
jgi:glycosyltransferase involved in cell wall biosynthesis